MLPARHDDDDELLQANDSRQETIFLLALSTPFQDR